MAGDDQYGRNMLPYLMWKLLDTKNIAKTAILTLEMC
jgi:hypothetical protein